MRPMAELYLLLLGLLLQENSRLLQSEQLCRGVMERWEFGCSDVIQVFTIPLLPGLCRQQRRAL